MFDSNLRPSLMRIQEEQLLKRPVHDNLNTLVAIMAFVVNTILSASNVYLSNTQDGRFYMGSLLPHHL